MSEDNGESISGKETARTSYQKPWLSYREQVELLQSRGLVVCDVRAAVDFLRHLNYYRFGGYCLAFEVSRHRFSNGVSFEQVLTAYEFDCRLRDLVTQALEIVELDFRTAVAYHFGRDYGAFGHTEPGSFFWRFNHAAWKERLHKEARRSREAFVLHFKAKYDEFPDLPVWVITEIMSFGALSKMCQGMMKVDQKKIAHRYGLQPDVWVSWLHHLTYVRNLCAHHARIWDRLWSIKPKLPRGEAWRPPSLPGNERLFTTLTILSALMRCCSPDAACSRGWWQHVKALVSQPPPVPNALDLMGFPADWDTHPLLK